MILILKICLLLAGQLLPCLCGYPVLKVFGLDKHTSKLERFILSFLFGWMMFSAIFAIAGFANLGFNVIGGVIIIVLLWGIFYYISRDRNLSCVENPKSLLTKAVSEPTRGKEPLANKIFKYTLIIVSATLFISIFIESAGDTESMPMNAVWGYKAMLFYKEGMIPLSFFSESYIPFTHQSYPLCYPVMLTWGYMCMGGVHEPLIKLIPPFLGLLVFLSLFTICRKENISQIKSLIIALLFCGCAPFNLSSTILYAENMLILPVMWGVYFMYSYFGTARARLSKCTTEAECTEGEPDNCLLFPGLLLLAGGAWVKNEGLVYFALVAGFVIVAKFADIWNVSKSKDVCTTEGRDEKKRLLMTILIIIIPALLFILPWQLFRYYLEVPVRDFAVIAKVNGIMQTGTPVLQDMSQIVKQSVIDSLYFMFVDLKSSCGVWYFLILAFFMLRKKIFRREVLFLLWLIFIPIAIFAVSFVFSTRPLKWHMDAIPRLLLIPASVAWIVIAVTFSPAIKTDSQKR